MQRSVALTTSIAVFLALGCGPKVSAATTDPSAEEILLEEHHSEHGFEADVVVIKAPEGATTSRATVRDPNGTDVVEFWTDGTTVRWDGTIGAEPVSGSAAATDILNPGDPPSPICLHPVAAIICVGAALVLLGGCSYGFSCDGSDPSGTPSNPPDSSGGGQGGGGDADDDSDDGD